MLQTGKIGGEIIKQELPQENQLKHRLNPIIYNPKEYLDHQKVKKAQRLHC